jgi:hypothetical protein
MPRNNSGLSQRLRPELFLGAIALGNSASVQAAWVRGILDGGLWGEGPGGLPSWRTPV